MLAIDINKIVNINSNVINAPDVAVIHCEVHRIHVELLWSYSSLWRAASRKICYCFVQQYALKVLRYIQF